MTSENESFMIKRLTELEEKAKKAHEEFLLREPPEFTMSNFIRVWSENNEFREKLLLAQEEYMNEQRIKTLSRRQYLEKVKEMDCMKKDHEKKIHDIHNTIEEMVKHTQELSKDLKTAQDKIAELEHQMKVECDTYLWNRKRMSRRIALLEYWMKRLFKYGSSPEARRNELTMTTEIPDSLIREGEDLLLETPASENSDE